DDTLSGDCQNDLLLGGDGEDSLTGGAGADILAGGAGNDGVTLAGAGDIVMFNSGGGMDRLVMESGTESFTLSLGGGIDLESLALVRSGDDLVLELAGSGGGCGKRGRNKPSDQILIEDWFETDTLLRPQVTLQLISDASIQRYDLADIVADLEMSNKSRWDAVDSALDAHLETSDGDALGGELAYRYGLGEDVSAMSLAAVLGNLRDPKLGMQPQSLGG
ncbi:MAG: hypothetical protein AB1450_14270, partial [Pseudomonadota bacterium]